MIEFLDFETDLMLFFYYSTYLMALFFCSMLFHELGHMIYFKYGLKKDVKIYTERRGIGWAYLVGKQEDYESLTETEYNRLNFAGIGLGLLPIIITAPLDTFFPVWLMLIPYFYGCRKDCMNIIKLDNLQSI
jgi:hypothetical protein